MKTSKIIPPTETMRHANFLFVDQYGNHVYAGTVKELREKCGGGRISKIYVDRGGMTIHVGYAVMTGDEERWFTQYLPFEREAD